MSTPKKLQGPQQTDADWPYITRLRPKTAMAGMTLLLLLAWSMFLAIDILGWFNPVLERPVWQMLFNDRPVEWIQWLVLAFSTVLSGYVAGRLDAGNHTRPARFFLWLAVGFGLMLIEDTGNIRHILTEEIVRLAGPNIFSVPSGFVVEAPYFLGLAAVPIYMLLPGMDVMCGTYAVHVCTW